jgi:hypothetical protein
VSQDHPRRWFGDDQIMLAAARAVDAAVNATLLALALDRHCERGFDELPRPFPERGRAHARPTWPCVVHLPTHLTTSHPTTSHPQYPAPQHFVGGKISREGGTVGDRDISTATRTVTAVNRNRD